MKKITAKFEMEVEPCPFCAEEDNLAIDKVDTFYRVWCENCNMTGPMEDMPNEAIDSWNHRPKDKAEHTEWIKLAK